MRIARPIRAVLLATTILATPALAQADPVTLTALAGTAAGAGISGAVGGVLGAVLGAVVTAGLGFLGQQLFGQALNSADQNVQLRTRKFDPHPPFRFYFGRGPQEGSVAFHHVKGGEYYVAFLLNSIPSDSLYRIEIADGQACTFATVDSSIGSPVAIDLADPSSDIYDMTKGARLTTEPWRDDEGTPYFYIWIGLGEQTQPPQRWLDEIGDVLDNTDKWAGLTVVFVRLHWGADREAPQKWGGYGVPIPLRFFGKWSKLYDPRKDGTSGVAGASGAHRLDDRTTWEWSDNPSLCALMLATHEFALGFDTEMIPIQQVADAADDCDTYYSSSASVVATAVSLDPKANAGTTHASGVANGVTISGFDPAAAVTLTLPAGQTYGAWSPWGAPSPANCSDPVPGNRTGAKNSFWVAPDGDTGRAVQVGTSGCYDGYEAARAAFGEQTITGGASYTFYFVDNPIADNTGGMDIAIDATAEELWGCNGPVFIKERELSLLNPVLATMAGELDTTDGLLGWRAGVWKAPTETLSQPIGDEVGVKGARDAGFDLVRASYIGPAADWQGTDGPGFTMRAGYRVHPLDLPLVASREQAAKLEKIFAGRAEAKAIVTATWDGTELNNRIGERKSFSLFGLPRSNLSYVVTGKSPVVEQREDGLEVSVKLTLEQDEAATYAWTAGDYAVTGGFTAPAGSTASLAAPLSVVAEQNDYASGDGSSVAARLKIVITLDQDTASAASGIEVQVNDGAGYETLKTIVTATGQTSYVAYLDPVLVAVGYTPRARAISASLGTSDWVVGNTVTIAQPVRAFTTDFTGAFI